MPDKHTQTPCEALGVKDITEQEKADLFMVAQKTLFDPDYCKSDSIIDIIGILGEEDTPSVRRCMGCLYSYVETVCELENRMKEVMSGGAKER